MLDENERLAVDETLQATRHFHIHPCGTLRVQVHTLSQIDLTDNSYLWYSLGRINWSPRR